MAWRAKSCVRLSPLAVGHHILCMQHTCCVRLSPGKAFLLQARVWVMGNQFCCLIKCARVSGYLVLPPKESER